MSRYIPPRLRRAVLLLLAATVVAVLFVRWHTTSSRRDAYDRLARLPCAFMPGFTSGFHNPYDFLSVRGDSVIVDMIHPPTITALEIREPLTREQRSHVVRDALVFSELAHVVLWPGSSDADVTVWRSQLPDHIHVHHRDAGSANHRTLSRRKDRTGN